MGNKANSKQVADNSVESISFGAYQRWVNRVTADDIRNVSLTSFMLPHWNTQVLSNTTYTSDTSVVGEFHKLGNLEEQGFELPAVKSFDGRWPSIKPQIWKPTVYHRGPPNNLYVYG